MELNICKYSHHVSVLSLQKAIQASNALTHGLKDRRRYRWYSVWDIWRRLLFVATNLFLGVATRSVVLVRGGMSVGVCVCGTGGSCCG